jgi:hypothetical protein
MLTTRSLIVTWIFVGCVSLLVAQEQPNPQAEVPADLKQAIEEAETMLQAEDLKPFLERYVHPRDKQRMQDSGQWNDVLMNFKADKADRLKAALAAAKTATAEKVTETQVIFKLPDDLDGPSRMQWEKTGDKWYINN